MLQEFQGKAVTFVEQMQVRDGVICDVYVFNDDDTCDLGIITIDSGAKTPKQKVLQGKRTVEGYLNGQGFFIHNESKYQVETETKFTLTIGDTMQWQAGDTSLQCYEICYPPYTDGRFENLE